MKQETCVDRLDRHFESRLDDLHLMFNPTKDDCTLGDDGTLDTVIEIGDREFRFSDTSIYRDKDTGELDIDELLEDEFDGIRESMYEDFFDYGLAFDYVARGTFNDQEEGYFRYQISWGGPSEEFRFYTGPDFHPYKVEFWLLDWGDGSCKTLHGDDLDLIMTVWEQFNETGTVQHVFEETTE